MAVVTAHSAAAGPQDDTWQFGGFADLAYLFDANDPGNHQTRSRGTSFHVNEISLNMAGVSARKPAGRSSRFGAELVIHAGKDAEVFGFSPTAPRLHGARWLRHVGRANLSYLAPTGTTIQAGIFASPIGYDSLYAKDNLNYTRPWTADFTPYLMLGINATHTFENKLTAAMYVVNGFWHLADANHVPSTAIQLAYSTSPTVTLKQTVLFGPHQSDSALPYWRVLSDTIIERKTHHWITALNFQAAAERVEQLAHRRSWWLAAQAPIQWQSGGPWRVAVRPEVAWDSDGRWTAFEQTVKAFTATVDYRFSMPRAVASLRLEYRTDSSSGPQGGFFAGDTNRLVPRQQLLIAGLVIGIE